MDPVTVTTSVIAFVQGLHMAVKIVPIVKAGVFGQEALLSAIGHDAEAIEASLQSLEQSVSIDVEADMSSAQMPSVESINDWAKQLHEIAQCSRKVVEGVKEDLVLVETTLGRRPHWLFGIKRKIEYDKWKKDLQRANGLLGIILGPTALKIR